MRIPWQAKVLVQFILSRAPYGEMVNHTLQHARGVAFEQSFLNSRVETLREQVQMIQRFVSLSDASVVEVGTGWAPLLTLLLRAAGAAEVHTYDHKRHLRRDLLNRCIDATRHCGLEIDPPSAESLDDALASIGIHYHAPGDAAKTDFDDHAVDVFTSYDVLEHVLPDTLCALLAEARRVLKPGGIFHAHIATHDHYNGFDRRCSKVNFLKYPDWLWNFFVKNDISYVNRLRERDYLDAIRDAGGAILHRESVINEDDLALVKRMSVAGRFQDYSPEELAVTATTIIAAF